MRHSSTRARQVLGTACGKARGESFGPLQHRSSKNDQAERQVRLICRTEPALEEVCVWNEALGELVTVNSN